MSVYDRKMFKRNARNALNASAGIPSVQNFQQGGSVQMPGSGYSTFTSPITGRTFRSRTPSGRGITSLQPFDIARRYIAGGRKVGYGADAAISPGEYALLQGSQTATLAGDVIQDPTDTRAGGILAGISRPFVQAGSGAVGFARGLTEQAVQGALSSSEGAGTDTFGQRVAGLMPRALEEDYLTSLGIVEIDPTAYSSPIGPQPAPTKIPEGGMAADRIKAEGPVDMSDPEVRARIAQEQQARAATERDGLYVTDEETGAFPPSTSTLESTVDDLMRQRQADEAAYQAAVDAADRDEADVVLVPAGTAKDKAGPDGQYDGDDLGTAPTAPTEEAEVTPKEEIERVINEGTPEEQEKTIDSFIKEFMDKAPGYEGADSGLVLAKIGFAMAAGKSPRAIENIATAMSDGADMLIKDKAKRDEFNRQLSLSALQYGLGEVGKLRAEDRLEQRERRGVKEMVVGAGGTTYKGKQYKENESIFIDVGDIRDGNMPENITNTATLTALANQRKAANALLKQQLDTKQISLSEYETQLKKYDEAVTTAITSEIGIGLLEGAMINTAEGKVTGVAPAIKSMLNEGANFFGMDLGKEYETLDDVRNAMRASLQDLVPVTLGAAQSANSISNRDVDFLIEAYFGAGALNGGRLAFVTQDEDQMVKRLQRAAGKMRDSQKGAFSTMNTVTNTLSPVFQPGTQQSAALGLSEQAQRLAQAGLSTSGTATFTQLGLTPAGTDSATGLPRFKIG
jgi:hypothetical protein